MKILAIAGSLRKASYTQRLVREASQILAPNATVETFDIGSLPHYNADLDGEVRPESVNELVSQIENADGLLIVTPEYNYAIPGVLKNAIDWASRPAYKSCLAHKPTAIMAASPGPVGGARAIANLRLVLGGTLTDVFPHPDVLINRVNQKFSDNALVDDSTKEHLEKFLGAYTEWVRR